MDASTDREQRIGGYRVVRQLARGSTSDVLLARAEGPHGFARPVVLKVLLPELTRDPAVARKFAREASACAQLSHPSIVRLYDFFSVSALEARESGLEEGQLVMVLEYVDGVPLNRLRSAVKAAGHAFDDRAALHVGACLFSALAAAHEALDERGVTAPIIHRDVNPSNVLVPWDGHVKLTDFGVAKVAGSSQDTQTGLLRGTYGYMAPEQVTGERPVTPRSDVYAAAVIVWELLARRRAFQRGALGEVEALRAMAEPRLATLDSVRPDVDASVRDAIRRALEPDPDARTVTAQEIVLVLRRVAPAELGRLRLVELADRVRFDIQRLAPSRPPPPTSRGEGVASVNMEQLVASRPPSKGPSRAPSGAPRRDSEAPTVTPRASPARPPGLPLPSTPPRPGAGPPSAPPPPRMRQESIADILEPTKRQRPSERSLEVAIGSAPAGRSLGDVIDEILEGAPAPSSGPKYPVALVNPGMRRPLSSEPERPLGLAELADIGRFPSRPPDPPTGLSETLAISSPPRARSEQPPSTEPMPKDATLAMANAPAVPRAPISTRPKSGAETLASSVPPGVKTSPGMPAVKPPAAPPLPTDRGARGGTGPLASTAILGGSGAHATRPSAATAAAPPPPPFNAPAPVAPPPPPAAHAASPPGAPAHPGSVPPSEVWADPSALVSVPPGPGAPPAPLFGAGATGSSVARVAPLVPMPASASGAISAPPPPRRRGGGLLVGFLVLAILGTAAVGIVLYAREHPRSTLGVALAGVLGEAPTTPASASVPASASASASAGASASAPTSAPASAEPATPASASASAEPATPASASASAGPATPASASASAEPATPASASASAGPANPAPSASTAAAPTSTNTDATKGTIHTAGARPGHRIYVDGRVVGQTPDSVVVRCGSRSVKLGSAGAPHAVDVPCGGETTVSQH